MTQDEYNALAQAFRDAEADFFSSLQANETMLGQCANVQPHNANLLKQLRKALVNAIKAYHGIADLCARDEGVQPLSGGGPK